MTKQTDDINLQRISGLIDDIGLLTAKQALNMISKQHSRQAILANKSDILAIISANYLSRDEVREAIPMKQTEVPAAADLFERAEQIGYADGYNQAIDELRTRLHLDEDTNA